jgi:hypothetical protein
MNRREFITLFGGAAAWPFAARGQPGGKIPTVGYFWHAGSPDVPKELWRGFPALDLYSTKRAPNRVRVYLRQV